MSLALYRKYRPRTFAEVIGQEHVTGPLSQALRSGRLHHAYLFSGPRGCGKTSSARILARSLNCAEGPTPDPCGTCGSCRALAPDGPGSIDVIEIDAASHGGVDDARELRERAFFAPASSRYKIYVIDEAHMVSSAGFNALLKLVEEPPDYVKFIFATTEPEKVLGTIKSRTHHYPFRLIPPGVLRPYLEQLCASEEATVEQAVFPLVVRAGGGSARDSLSVLDQLIAGAGSQGVTYAGAVSLLGVTDAALIDEMCDALAATDGAAAFATVDRVVEAGHDPRRFASDLLERLRDLIVLRQVPDAVAKGLLDAPSDQLERMSLQAQRMGQATLSRCADIVHNGLVEMRGTTSPRLLLELIAARMLLPAADDANNALLQRLERMERRLTLSPGEDQNQHLVPATASPAPSDAPARPVRPAPDDPAPAPPAVPESRGLSGAPVPASVPAPGAPEAAPVPAPPSAAHGAGAAQPVAAPPTAPAPAKAGDPGVLDAAAVRRVWGEILSMVGLKSKKVAAVAREATVRDLDGQTLILTFKHTAHAALLTSSPTQLQDAIYEVLGGRWQIICEIAGDQRPPPRSAPAAQAATARTPSVPAARDGGTAAQWPEPARPGGTAPDAPPAGEPPPDQGSWPTTARPGGATATAVAEPGAAPSRPAAQGRPATSPTGQSRTTASTRNATAAPASDAKTAARAAARGARIRPPATAADSAAWSDGSPADEPPYDPEYDGPPRSGMSVGTPTPPGSTYEGFDPGDEPLDDVIDEATARQSGEQQAMRLLKEKLGAEKIGEVELR